MLPKCIKHDHICQLIKGCKRERILEKTKRVKINEKCKKYILRGQRNTRYYEIILSNRKKSYNLT